jgi:two-component system, OmpR family, sensor histidine kinase BaeS
LTWRLRTRLTLSYVLMALLCVLMVSALANGVLESSFRRYARNAQARNAQAVVVQVGAQLRSDGAWDQAGLTAVGMAALEQGMIIKLSTPDGFVVWDATVHNGGLCVQMLDHLAENMASRYPNWRGSYSESLYPVRSGFRDVASLVVGYYGPFSFSDQELAFINSLNLLLVWATLAALVLAGGIGLFMARRITVPLERIALSTQRIASGHRDVQITGTTKVRELDAIARTVNDLSRSLGEQEALRRRLTTDMAHELRTPLATLQSHLEALIDGVWEAEPARLTGLHGEILRINRMVADMENLARYESNSLVLTRMKVDLVALSLTIVANHQPQFRMQGIDLCFASDLTEAWVSADSDKLSQAVINLLSNALKFTASGGSVKVRVGGSKSGVSVSVLDTGIGIAAKDLPLVFERFYRADSSRARATGGSGIGLAITRAIVEAHGGTITATSVPGKGSEFVIAFPRAT